MGRKESTGVGVWEGKNQGRGERGREGEGRDLNHALGSCRLWVVEGMVVGVLVEVG